MSSVFIPNQGRDIFNGDSFRSRLIFRLVASIKYFLSVRDIERVEKGLITLLRIIGYISGDFVHVRSKMKSLSTFLFMFLVTIFLLSSQVPK